MSFNELLEPLSKPPCFLYFVPMSNVSHVFADCDRESHEGWLVNTLSDSAWKMICETCAMFFSLIVGICFSRQNLLSFEAAHMLGNQLFHC